MIGEGLALAALLMFSTNIIITKIGSARISLNAGFLIAVSMNVAFSALLLLLQLVVRTEPLRWNALGVLEFMAAGLFSTYLGRWFILESIARLGPAKASAFQVSSPLFTVVIAWMFLGERLGTLSIVAILIAMVGLLLVSVSPRAGRAAAAMAAPGPAPPPAATTSFTRLRRLVASGIFVGMGSSAAYAVGNVFRGAAVRQWNEVVLGALIGAVTAIVLHLTLGAGRVRMFGDLRTADRRGVLLFALSGVLTITAQICTIAAMARAPVAIVALITLCTPLVVFPVSYFILRNQEGIGLRTVVGGVLTIVGIAILLLQ